MLDYLRNYLIYLISYLYWFIMVDLLPLEIKFGWDQKFYLHIQKHSDFIRAKFAEYALLAKKLSRPYFLQKVLSDNESLPFIVFSLPGRYSDFVQFNRYKKKLYLDYPATSIDDDSYERQAKVEKLLIKEGFSFNQSGKDFTGKQYYFEALDRGKTLRAYFGEDYRQASAIAEMIFEQIYQSEDKVEIVFR